MYIHTSMYRRYKRRLLLFNDLSKTVYTHYAHSDRYYMEINGEKKH